MNKQQTAEEIARLEDPSSPPEAQAFYAAQLVKGFGKPELDIKLKIARERVNLPPDVAPESHQTAQDGQDGTGPGAAVTSATETAGTALEPVDAAHAAVAARGALPDETRWASMERISKFIAKSDLAPGHLRGKPDHVLMILLVANDLGISATQAMQKVSVIEGQPALSAELMVAMVLRDGHRIWPDPGNDRKQATAHGQRREHDGGWGPVMSASFTLEDAEAAGLVAIKEDKAWSRSKQNNPLPWELYTPDLLWARAVSRLVRRGFADAGAGVTYVPEELGYIEADDDDSMTSRAAAQEQATVTINQQRSEIARRIAELPEDDRGRLRDEWKRRNLPKPDDLSPAAIRTATNLLETVETAVATRYAAEQADVQDAEVVPDAEQTPEQLVQTMVAEGLVTKGVPVNPDDEVTNAEVMDDFSECACGDGPETAERPFVWSEDGKPYHADDAPFLA